MCTSSAGHVFELSGGALCLDFANTVSERLTEPIEERLATYADLVSWGRQTGSVTEREAEALEADAAAEPARARSALRRAIRLRETIYRVFEAVAADRAPSPVDLQLLNQWFLDVARRRHVAPARDGFRWEWRWSPGESLERPLWPVAQSAADLLTSDLRDATRKCAADNCGWLFLDQSRNHSRRWCNMKVCGNREKARRFYQRRV